MAPQSVKEKKKNTKKKKNAKNKEQSDSWDSRAVLRLIEAGSATDCPACDEPVKYRARQRDMQVICNIYEDGVWQKVEHYHEECYKKEKQPYGQPIKKK